jgi:hypothetical protein
LGWGGGKIGQQKGGRRNGAKSPGHDAAVILHFDFLSTEGRHSASSALTTDEDGD